jgi:hypothetical protein
MKISKRPLALVALAALVGALTIAGPAAASRNQSVRCVGAADYCGATVSIAGGAKNRIVSVNLTSTNLRLIRVWGLPASRSAFKISKAGFRLGGSVYRFTLNAWVRNPPRARIILLFGAGSPGLRPPGVGSETITAHAIFRVGVGKTVSIVGGGGGTSNCTTNETNTTFTTTSNDEKHDFAFLARDEGACNTSLSWSWFRVNIRNPDGKLIGSGTMYLGVPTLFGDYQTSCDYEPWVGASCTSTRPEHTEPGNYDLVISR